MKKFSPDIPYLYLRGKIFVYRMVIPAHLRMLAGRSEFKHSLKTKDFTIALEKYGGVDKYYQQQLERLRAGESLTQTKETTHAELVELAKLKGHEFHPLSDLLENPKKFPQIQPVNILHICGLL